MHENILAHSGNVGSALAAGPFALGNRLVDKRRSYT
jgi:2-methylaconitate cis-trans-isomerase PrpF